MDRKLAAENRFFPQWMSDHNDGNLSPKVAVDNTLIVKNDYHNRYGHSRRNGLHGDGLSNLKQIRIEKSSSIQVNGLPVESQLIDRASCRSNISLDKRPRDADIQRRSKSSFQHSRRGSASVLDDINSGWDKKRDIVKNGKTYISLDEEFPLLNGDVIIDNDRTVGNKIASVWDNASREPNAVVQSPSSGSDASAKTSGLSIKDLSKRMTGVKQKMDQQVTSLSKTSSPGIRGSGGRTMTVLGGGVANVCHKEHTPLKSVGKVVAQELENRKGTFMKLVRRDSHEPGSSLSRTESCSQVTALVACCDQKISKTWAAVVQNSTESDDYNDDSIGDVTDSSSCTSMRPDDLCELKDFDLEAERKLLVDMGWNETDETDALTVDEVYTFVGSCPDFSRKWELLIDRDIDENGVIKFILTRREPHRR